VDSYNSGAKAYPPYINGVVNTRALQSANDSLKRLQAIYDDPTSDINNYYSYLSGFNSAGAGSQFASGGAFTNGVVDRPTSFNMGLMGESGSEAIMPLHNIGNSLGIRAIIPASNDSSNDNAETITELKESNRQLGAVITVLQGKLDQILQENRKQTEALDSMQSTARVNSKVAAKR
jgi:phage-related minor tail protein